MTSYFYRESGTRNKAHYWDGSDTLCRMWTTGGMNQRRKWIVSNAPHGHPLCTRCINVTRLMK